MKDKILKKLLLIGGIVFVVLLPFIINLIYLKKPPVSFFDIGFDYAHSGYEPGELLEYYGVVLSFAVTSALSIMVYLQNKKISDKAEEVNELMLKLQQEQYHFAKKHLKSKKKIG